MEVPIVPGAFPNEKSDLADGMAIRIIILECCDASNHD
jgi:hypothetical protein